MFRNLVLGAAAILIGFGMIGSAAASTAYRSEHGQPLNDLQLTPGAVFPVTVATICRRGYASTVRHVSASEKTHAYAEYRIVHHVTGQYEIDHLISLELGGSNAMTNLWPELNDHPRGHLNSKDILENKLHALVCAHAITLATAQHLVATDWVAEYHRVFGIWPGVFTIGKASNSTLSTGSTSLPSTATSTSIARQSGTVRITSIIGSVTPGGDESLTAHSSKANDLCTLSVKLPSGRLSTESGLGTMSADAAGSVRWTWKVGPTTGSGIANASVACIAGVAVTSFTIT